MADYDREYGPDTEMPELAKAVITRIVAFKDCTCASLRQYQLQFDCSRCEALEHIKKHWPWWYFTTIGNMGADNGA